LDITYLPSPVRGQYYYLYVFLDTWSRRIMGFQVREMEDSQLASQLPRRICDEHQLESLDVALHSDNGPAIKGSTMLREDQGARHFVTPHDRHTGRDIAILENRNVVYAAAARQRHPRRWTGSARKWHRPRVVMLNPETATKVRLKAQAMVA